MEVLLQATSSPTGYLVVRYPSAAATTTPATGTTYTVGQSLGLGTVVSVGASTTFNSTRIIRIDYIRLLCL
jgi:hypothetical protein